MSAPKIGDRVRVVLEGEVEWADPKAFAFAIGNPAWRHQIQTRAEAVVSVEILPRPLKVGDTIEGDQYATAPIGTVVRASDGSHCIRCVPGRWSSTSGSCEQEIRLPRTVVYIPEATS